jgi:PAS domain S-box-containing protein
MEGKRLKIPETALPQPDEAAAWLAAIVASSDDAIIGKRLDGTVVSWNAAATRLFGYREEEMIGQSIRRLIPEDRQQEESSILAEIATGERVEHYATVRRRKDGEQVDVSVTISPVRNAAGEIVGASKMARDITRQKKSQDLQRESERRLAAILEALPIGVALVDENGATVSGNEVYRRFIPRAVPSRDQARAGLWIGYGEDGRSLDPSDYPAAKALRGEPAWPGVEFLYRGDEARGPVWTRVAALPFRDDSGKVVGATVVVSDIDEEKRARDALAENELRMRIAQEAAHAGTWEWRLADNVNTWSGTLWDLYGLDAAEWAPSYSAWAASIHPQDRERVFAAIGAAAAAGEEFEAQWRVNLPEGEPERWLLSRGKPVGPPGAPERYLGIVIDITERKRAEEALRKKEGRLNLALSAGRLSTWDRDFAKEEVVWNDEHYRIMGYAVGAVTPSYRAFLERVHPEDKSMAVATFNRAVQEGGDYLNEFRVLWPDGTIRWLEARGKMERNAEGRSVRSYGVMIDTTDRKRDEEHVKLLLREVNHRTKNMLALVLAIARQTLTTKPEDFLARFGERVQALSASQDLLVKSDWKGVDLRDLVETQLAPFKELLGARIELGGPAKVISAAAAQTLGMTLHELITNAGKYGALSNAAGSVEIAWRFEKDGAGDETFSISWRERGGPAVSEPRRQGFGSAVIGRLAESSLDAKVDYGFPPQGFEWRLRCRTSELIEGERQSPARAESKRSRAPLRERPRILIVEDEPLVALEIARVIKEAGFEAVGPAGSVAAAAMLLAERGCDAAVLDINLGKETSEPIALELRRRGAPFVTVSGYAPEQHSDAFKGAPALAKPLRPELLIAEIRRRLG